LRLIEKPEQGEYPAYADMYISLVPNDGRLLEHFETSLVTTLALVKGLSEGQLLFRYAEGKWTIKEILVHLIDDERIYVYRALRFARRDKTELPGFEQDDFARYSGANERSIESILDEFMTTRKSTISFFAGLEDAAFLRSGIGSGNKVTVRALAYHIAGHEMRHMNIIRERYL